jgi:hypothetical protein
VKKAAAAAKDEAERLAGLIKEARKLGRDTTELEKKKEVSTFLAIVLGAREKALKVVANSVYGFTGVSKGVLPGKYIAETVTTMGRAIIIATKTLIEAHFCQANGYEYDAKIIYGDTDSVMIHFGPISKDRAFELGFLARNLVNDFWSILPPLKVDFENVYGPFILFKKKKYAGVKNEPPKEGDVLQNRLVRILSESTGGQLTGKPAQLVSDFTVDWAGCGVKRVVYEMHGVLCCEVNGAQFSIDAAKKEFFLPDDTPAFSCDGGKKILFHIRPDVVVKKYKAGKTTKASKGLGDVRRDSCRFVSQLLDETLRIILLKQDLDLAVSFVKRRIQLLVEGKIDMSELIISKTLSKEKKAYKSASQVQKVLHDKLVKRDAESAPRVGDRMEFVIVRGMKNDKVCQLAEEPGYVLANKCPIDYMHYVEHQARNPISQIFAAFLPNRDIRAQTLNAIWNPLGPKADLDNTSYIRNPKMKWRGIISTVEELFSGPHTARKWQPKISVSSLGRHIEIKPSCYACHASLSDGKHGILCRTCLPAHEDILLEATDELNKAEQLNYRCWITCTNCTKQRYITDSKMPFEKTGPGLCANTDCPIFYKRQTLPDECQRLSDVVSALAGGQRETAVPLDW